MCVCPGLFWQNPQFYFVLSEADSSKDERSCSFVLALMQKHQRRRGTNLSIALYIYQVHTHAHTHTHTLRHLLRCYNVVLCLQASQQNTYLSPEDLSRRHPVCCSPQYSPRREVVLRSSLPPGRYIIIPSTYKANEQGEFLLRVLTEQGSTIM